MSSQVHTRNMIFYRITEHLNIVALETCFTNQTR